MNVNINMYRVYRKKAFEEDLSRSLGGEFLVRCNLEPQYKNLLKIHVPSSFHSLDSLDATPRTSFLQQIIEFLQRDGFSVIPLLRSAVVTNKLKDG